jgi:hypothetical protein
MRTPFQVIARIASGALLCALLTACGGGGGGGTDNSGSSGGSTTDNSGSSGGSPGSTTTEVTVVPALGAFSGGAIVEVFDASTGTRIGTQVSTAYNGTATIDLSSQNTSFVIRVTGAPSVSYYDEASGINLPLLASQSLLAMVPTSLSPSGNVRIGVTPLTHMAAAFAGLSNSNLRVTPASGSETVPQTMAKAYARVRYAMGLGNVDASLEPYLNPLVAPTALSATNRSAGIDLSTQGGYYGLLLAEMAQAGANSTTRYSPINLAQALANEAATLVTSNYSAGAITAFTSSEPRLVLAQATNTLGAGNSSFINSCVNIPADTRTRLNNAMFNAYAITDLSTSPDQLAQTVLTQTRQQLGGTTANMTSTRSTAAGCT